MCRFDTERAYLSHEVDLQLLLIILGNYYCQAVPAFVHVVSETCI